MKYTKLGQTDLKVSRICLGTMTFGEQNSEAEGHQQLDYALDQGVNFIDTAELYAIPSTRENNGATERIIGSWISSRGKRDQYVVATKVTGPSANLSYIRKPLRFTREQIRTAVVGSLQRLQTDYIDLYQLHWPERKTNYFGQRGYRHNSSDDWQDNFLSVLETMQELVDEGKIRYFGISNETPWGTMRYLRMAEQHGLPRAQIVQNPYSLLNRLYEVGMAEISLREKCGLLAYSPMAFGLLSGKYHEKRDQGRDRLNKFKQMSRYNRPQAHEATAAYLELAGNLGVSLAQLALAFVNTRSFLCSNIIGATNMEQLKENIASIELEITPDIEQQIDAIHERIPNPAP